MIKMKTLIVGYSRSGKTKYSKKYSTVIHLDDLIKDIKFQDIIYFVLDNIRNMDNWVVEGMQGVRLFRKMLQRKESLPDEVIWIRAKFPVEDKHKSNRKMLRTLWMECMELNYDIKVKIIYI